MKFFPNLIKSAVLALDEIINGGMMADKVVETLLKSNTKWGSRDRNFVADAVYDCIRNRRFFQAKANIDSLETLENLYKLISVHLFFKYNEIPDLPEFKGFELVSVPDILERKILESYPDWLDSLLEKELGAEIWNQEAKAQNAPSEVVLRVNTLKTTKKEVKAALLKLEIETKEIENNPDALVLLKRKNLQNLELYKNGFIEIQDASSQLIANFLELNPGLNVIDACAGAGGKAIHIAALMKNSGKITALDISEFKLNQAKIRAKRAGVRILATQLANDFSKLKNSADRLLLDVPCSGLGVLRRNPDSKWKLTPDFMVEIIKTQAEILENYSEMLKVGGILVYATCSILPSENNLQIDLFLKNNPNFEFIKDRKLFAYKDDFDGFYMAKLKRNR